MISIAVIDAFTSILCGTMVFSILGYIATSQGREVDDVLESGPGLIFMVMFYLFVLSQLIKSLTNQGHSRSYSKYELGATMGHFVFHHDFHACH